MIVGPTVGARYRPGALVGLPLLSVVLAPLAATGLQAWALRQDAVGGPTRRLADLLAPLWTQLLIGFLVTWALLALWGLVAIAATTQRVRLDESAGMIARRHRGRREMHPLAEVSWAVGEGTRDASALVGLRGDEQDPWVIPHVGWDDASFDGLRALQLACGLRPSPPRGVLVAEDRRRGRARAHREMAERVGLPWRAEYEHDVALFQRDFDHVRRVLGGKEPAHRERCRPDG